ncbi:MAG: hypothetical protein ABJA49_12315 [Betaproteobacteria bacterium]
MAFGLGQLRYFGGESEHCHAVGAVGDAGIDLAADRRAVQSAITIEKSVKHRIDTGRTRLCRHVDSRVGTPLAAGNQPRHFPIAHGHNLTRAGNFPDESASDRVTGPDAGAASRVASDSARRNRGGAAQLRKQHRHIADDVSPTKLSDALPSFTMRRWSRWRSIADVYRKINGFP